MKKEVTPRGFGFYSFVDYNGTECTVQESSLATDECIWIGANKLEIKEFVPGQVGWHERPEFDEGRVPDGRAYIGNNRMHLTREQVAELLPILQKFVETGEL
jgi:hypothetical protein